MDFLTAKIEAEFGEKFSFLKLLEVTYNKTKKECLVVFLYPEMQKDFNDKEKQEITDFVKKQLSLNGLINVKFKKSYLDDNLILDCLKNYIKTDLSAINAFLDKKSVKIIKNFSEIEIFFQIDEEVLKLTNEEKLKLGIKKHLENNFCADFKITIEKIKGKEIEDFDFALTPNVFRQKTPRYQVELGRNLFGGEITPCPEFIKNIKKEKNSVILAGKIENIAKKSYISKKGKTAGQEKHYYAFELNDTTGKLDVRYFTTKSNEKQLDKLVNGDEILILGDIKEFNKHLTYYINGISRCKLPEKIEYFPQITDEYELIFPKPHSILEQSNLFKQSNKLTEDVLNKTYVVFDVETTGIDYLSNELLEIGAVKIKNGNIVEKFQTLIKPQRPIPYDATLINNITDDMVKDAPEDEIVLRDFYRFTKNSILVGYNVSFDLRFIQQYAKKQGFTFENEFVDVLPLAKSKLRLTRYKLTDVVKRLEINLEGAHRALADALATAETFLKLSEI